MSDAMKAVLTGYDDLIRAELDSDKLYRFKRIVKLCQQAGALAQLSAANVKDNIELEAMGEYHNEVGIGQVGIRRARNLIVNPHDGQMDQTDMIREIISMFEPLIRKQFTQSTEKRLSSLLDIRTQLEMSNRPTTAIDARIDETLKELDKENNDDATDLVRTDLLRGHPTGGNGGRQVPDEDRELVGSGEVGATQAPEDSSEERVGRERDRSGHPTNDRAIGTDPQGAGVFDPALESWA